MTATEDCTRCGGSGRIPPYRSALRQGRLWSPCRDCDGPPDEPTYGNLTPSPGLLGVLADEIRHLDAARNDGNADGRGGDALREVRAALVELRGAARTFYCDTRAGTQPCAAEVAERLRLAMLRVYDPPDASASCPVVAD